MSSVFVRYPCLAINDIVQYTTNSGFLPYILLFTHAPNLVWFDGTIIDISTILLTMYNSGYVGLRLVQYNGGFLPEIILSTQGYYHWGSRLNTM